LTGFVTARAQGTVTISAEAVADKNAKGAMVVQVIP